MNGRELNTLERDARRLWREWGDGFAMFGRCVVCGRLSDEDGRPLFVRGRRRGRLVCLACFDQGAR
jgi:hypothetical protein